MATQSVQQVIKHPAWEAVEQFLTDVTHWHGFWGSTEPAYTERQIAEAMIATGYAADLAITERDEQGDAIAWRLPDYDILNVEADFPVNRRPKSRAARWLIARVLDQNMRPCEVKRGFIERHLKETGRLLSEPDRSIRAILAAERHARRKHSWTLCYSEPAR